MKPNNLLHGPSIGTPLSDIHFQGKNIRQVSYYTLLRRFQLPWPRSCCPYVFTPFVGSDKRWFRLLNSSFRFIPHRQFCLPKTAHLRLSIRDPRSLKQHGFLTYLKYENSATELLHQHSNHYLYPIKLLFNLSYPGGNFGRNQLPDSSISLSPLYSIQRIDLHVRIPSAFHQGFPWLQPDQAKFTVFRVSANILFLGPFINSPGRTILHRTKKMHDWNFREPNSPLLSLTLFDLTYQKTRTFVKLLGPCFKTGEIKKFRQYHKPIEIRSILKIII